MKKSVDVTVVGAGAAGLIAALEVALTGRSVTIVEAKDRCGGRMHTFTNASGTAIELGAEFIHGKLPITFELLKKAGAKAYKCGGAGWRKEGESLRKHAETVDEESAVIEGMKALKEDVPLDRFMQAFLLTKNETARRSLVGYAEGYYAADTSRLSTLAMLEEMTEAEDEDFRPEGGYGVLMNYLEQQCRAHGVTILLSNAVQSIEWMATGVRITTAEAMIQSLRAIITVSVGVLQAGSIAFKPALPQKMKAIQQLGFGHAQKVVLQFALPFWKQKAFTHGQNMRTAGFIFSEEAVPTWWTHHPKNDAVLTGWFGGPKAAIKKETANFVAEGLQSLARIFSIGQDVLNGLLLSAHHHNWSGDEHVRGAYSYAVVGREALINEVLKPVADCLFFAGEGLYIGKEFGTVEAALHSGREVARTLLSTFPPR